MGGGEGVELFWFFQIFISVLALVRVLSCSEYDSNGVKQTQRYIYIYIYI